MKYLLCATVLGVLVATEAIAGIAGTYRCSSYNVDGAGGSCSNLASIVLNADGTYQISSETGSYTTSGAAVLLSPASNTWGSGTLQGGNQLVFDYSFGGRRQVVTYTCQTCAAAANWSFSGGLSSGVFNLAVRPDSADYYQTGNLYVAALAGGRFYFLKNRGNVFFTTTPNGDFDVISWTGGAIPVFTSIALDPTITFSLKLGSTAGLSESDLLGRGKYSRVYVFP